MGTESLYLPNFIYKKSIPESTLQTWADTGANKTAQATHESIRKVVDKINFPAGMRPTVYLQGSYKNSTNIRSDSDVDIVIEFPYKKNLLFINNRYEADKWVSYCVLVLGALRNHFGDTMVSLEKKCIKIKKTSWSLAADIVVALPYCRTTQFTGIEQVFYTQGIKFYIPSENRWVINYPEQHYKWGAKKNSPQQTNGWYKPTVRIFKNAIAQIASDAPSYFLECLIYNVPDQLFGLSYQNSFDSALNYLSTASLDKFRCQNHELKLFGASPEQWSITAARDVINRLINLRSSY